MSAKPALNWRLGRIFFPAGGRRLSKSHGG